MLTNAEAQSSMPCMLCHIGQLGVYQQSVVMQVERAQLSQIGNDLRDGAIKLAALGPDNAANSEDEYSSAACIALSRSALCGVHFWVGVSAVA